MTLTIGSLFSGIGGFERGLEAAGLGPVKWQVEINPFCQRVLRRHYPGVRQYADVREVGRENLEPVDVLCGGFPCQDVSSGGRGEKAGLAGARSGLWREFRRIAVETRPAIILVENVASGRDRWLPHVRRDLHVLGYGTRALSISAEDVGAPHRRQRIFVVAMADAGDDRRALGGPAHDDDGDHETGDELDGRPPPARFPPAPMGWGEQAEADYQPSFLGGSPRLPDRLDRFVALGNSVMPAMSEAVGRAALHYYARGGLRS